MAKSKNLKTQGKFNWHELIDKKFVAIYIALALVLVVNQIVFSVLLTDRNQAKADIVVFGNDVVGDINYPELTDIMEIILPPADRAPNVLAIDKNNEYAYVGTFASGGFDPKVIKIDLSDFSRVGELTFPGLGNIQTGVIDNTNTYAYFSLYESPTVVNKVRLSDFTVVDTTTLTGDNTYMSAIDDNYVYFGSLIFTGSWTGHIERIDLATFTLDLTALDTGGYDLVAGIINGSTGYFSGAYDGGGTHASVFKVDLSTFSLTDTITYPNFQSLSANGLAIEGDNLWVSREVGVSELAKIDISSGNFVKVDADAIVYGNTTGAWINPLTIEVVGGLKIDAGNQLAYLAVQPNGDATWLDHEILLKVDLTDGVNINAGTGNVFALSLNSLSGSSGAPTAFDIDWSAHMAYVASPEYPAYIEKVDLSSTPLITDPVEYDTLDLPVTLDQSRASVIDTNNEYLYVADWIDPPQIARINLYDFTLESVLTLDSTLYSQPYSAAIDVADGYAYFGISQTVGGAPTALLKVDIDPARSFEVVDVLDLAAYAIAPYGQMLIDPDNDLLYWGYPYSDDILKIDLVAWDPTLGVGVEKLTLTDSISSGNFTGVIDLANQYVYYAVNDIADNHGRIVKIDLSTFTESDKIELAGTENDFVASLIDPVNNLAYFYSTHGPLVKFDINPTNFVRLDAITLPSGGPGIGAGIDTNLKVAFFTSGDKINKVDVDPTSTFALLNQIDIADSGDLLIDNDAGFLYLVTKDLTPIGVEKYSYTLAGFMYAYKVTVTSTIAEVDFFKFYSNIADGSFMVGLYDSAKNKLWQSNDIVNSVAGDWVEISVSNGTPSPLTNLLPGDYYLAFQTSSPEPVASQISGGEGFKVLNDYGSLPPNVGGETPNAVSWSIYAAFVTTISGGGTAALGAPTDLACQVINDNTIRWNFMDNSYDEIGFRLYNNEGMMAEINSQQGTEQYYIDETDLTPGTLYENRYVVAYNDAGESEPSNLATCTTTTVGGGGALPVGFDIGDLLKTPDVTTVYVINSDYKRHPFPNEATYFSWYPDFSPIKIISMNDLSTIAIGSNVTVRPGTNLIKIQSVNKVYAVEPVGAIRWIENADTAAKLYGQNWAGRVIDISPAFFVDYTESYPVAENMHPTGSLIRYLGGANIYYIDSGIKRLVSSEQFTRSNYQQKYILTGLSADLTYPTGETMTDKTIIGYLK